MRKTESTLLIIDDDEDVIFASRVFLKRFFTTILTLDSPQGVHKLLNEHEVDVVLLDMNYRIGVHDGKEGLYWLEKIQEFSPQTVVILMTAYSEVQTAIEGIKKGAFDFIEKPWNNEKLLASMNAGVQLSRSLKKSSKLEQINHQAIKGKDSFVIGSSKAFSNILATVEKVAKTDANVLLLGENGTGKYVIAKWLHENSTRSDEPFIHVDLGSLHENLFESELFGHAKGAFTDAKETTLGRFELAEGGTLFLDEIGNLPLHLQAKLLSVLQNREIVRLGESKPRKVDVRIVCATNMDLHEAVHDQHFRQDLLYRINTVELTLPPLRERTEDIEELAHYFLEKNKKKYRKGKLQWSKEAMKAMKTYPWYGNVRELEHVIERAVILCDQNEIVKEDLQFSSSKFKTAQPETLHLETMEKYLIEKALKKHQGNISHASKELGITRAALYRRMEKHNL